MEFLQIIIFVIGAMVYIIPAMMMCFLTLGYVYDLLCNPSFFTKTYQSDVDFSFKAMLLCLFGCMMMYVSGIPGNAPDLEQKLMMFMFVPTILFMLTKSSQLLNKYVLGAKLSIEQPAVTQDSESAQTNLPDVQRILKLLPAAETELAQRIKHLIQTIMLGLDKKVLSLELARKRLEELHEQSLRVKVEAKETKVDISKRQIDEALATAKEYHRKCQLFLLETEALLITKDALDGGDVESISTALGDLMGSVESMIDTHSVTSAEVKGVTAILPVGDSKRLSLYGAKRYTLSQLGL